MASLTPQNLTVSISPFATVPKGVKPASVESCAEFVLGVLHAHLPTKFVLDGATQTEIRIGSSGDEARYSRDGDRSICYAEDFDWAAWKTGTTEAQEELLLEAISAIIDRVVHAFRGDRRALKEAVKQVRKTGFQAEIRQPELSSSPKGTSLEFRVLREVTRTNEAWKVEIWGAEGRLLRTEVVATGVARADAEMRFQKSRWADSEFTLLDAKGKPSFRLPVDTAALA